MSLNLGLPSVKYVVLSYYLVATGCRRIISRKYTLFNYSIVNKFTCANHPVRFVSTRQRPEEPPWRILFFGTDNFSLACLQPLNAKLNTGTLLSGLGVISSPGSLISKFAESERLPVHTWPPDETVLTNYDMGIVVSYGKLIPANIIHALPLGIINVHGSLLPRWRGASPITYAVMNGDAETGVTIMQIKPNKFDIGDIVRQYRCSISPNETTPELAERLAKHAGLLLMECIRDLPRCLDMATAQPREGVTYAPKVTTKLSAVDWQKMSARKVYDLHRAISHKYPLSTTWFGRPVRLYDIELDYETMAEKKRYQNLTASHKSALSFLHSSDISFSQDTKIDLNNNTANISPGLVTYSRLGKVVRIQCADGKWVRCGNFKVGNGPRMAGYDFFNGFLSKRNSSEWFLK